MDVSALSDDNFNAIDWVNSTLQRSNDQPNKEAVVSSLVSKLQLYVQQVNSALEDTSQQVLASMPRIMKDAQHLQTEALQLKSKMAEVQKDIFQVQKETGSCMAHLERLDSLKTKLAVAKDGLQESDGWGKLVAELEDLFEQGDVTKSCEKLKLLQKSFAAQAGLAGQPERESQIEGFKNRLEALTSTAVVQCFTSGDAAKSRQYVNVFREIGRLPQLIQYYSTVQKQIWQQHWAETIELSQNSNSAQFLREFYDFLFESVQKQQKWCAIVFGASESFTPISIVAELLPNLQPSRESAVMDLLKRNDEKLSLLQEISAANVHFGRLFSCAFEDKSENELTLVSKLADSIYDYFNTFIGQTASIEQNWLARRATELQTICPTASESVRALGNANSKVFQWAEETLKRCALITQYCGLPSIVVVLTEFFKSTLDKYRKAQQQLHASQGTENDWNLLQTCITLLQHIGDFHLKLCEFEEMVSSATQEKGHAINGWNNADILSTLTTYKLSGKREKNEFRKLVDSSRTKSNFKQLGGIFAAIFDQIKPICEYVHDTTLASIFAPIENQLKNISPEPNDVNDLGHNDLPDYSYSPQEFITVIGQYLLTLPQHLEPLLLTPNQQLKAALQLCDERYARTSAANEACADVLLSLLVDECCALYSERIGQICELNARGAKQLACDIDYLNSVVEELGLGLSSSLQQTTKLLRAPAENYLAISAGCDPRLVTAIRQKRNIVSRD